MWSSSCVFCLAHVELQSRTHASTHEQTLRAYTSDREILDRERNFNLESPATAYDDTADSAIRPPTSSERAKVLAIRKRRGRVVVSQFDTLNATPEQADPRWHRPTNDTVLTISSPTTVVWTINTAPPKKVLFHLKMSIRSVVRQRETRSVLRLFLVVVSDSIGPSSSADAVPDFCAELVPGWHRGQQHGGKPTYALGERTCNTLSRSRVPIGCTLPHVKRESPRAWVSLTIAYAIGDWSNQSDNLIAWKSWLDYIGPKHRGRRDLINAAPVILSRYFVAPKLLLSLGVERFIYLDADTCAMKKLDYLYGLPLSSKYPFMFARRQRHDDVYTREYYNLSNPLAHQYGFYNDNAQAVNTGVFLVDTVHMCRQNGFARVARLARELLQSKSTLFGRNVGFDQPLGVIALAKLTTYADPRWNCRRPWRAFAKCFLLHTRNCAKGIHSGLPDAMWLADERYFQRPP